jgi:NNP family nitrate/nitrite transporter-like MFS transporter
MFLPPIMGTRKTGLAEHLLLIIPLVGWGDRSAEPDTSYTVLLVLAFLAGIGGGVFSGFMPSTSYFFPKRQAGHGPRVQAGIGNFGVSIVQFVTPWIVGFSPSSAGAAQNFVDPGKGIEKQVWYQNAGWIWVPFVIVAVIFAYTMLRSVPVKAAA